MDKKGEVQSHIMRRTVVLYLLKVSHEERGQETGTSVQSLEKYPFARTGTLEKAMAPHSSTLAWKIPWTEEPGRLQSMESPRVGHD